jgi:hypothetical protein
LDILKERLGMRKIASRWVPHDLTETQKWQAVANLFDRWCWEVLYHPPYSPDLSPCDFVAFASELFQRFFRQQTAPFELSTQQALLKVSYDFHIAGSGLYTKLVTMLKDSKTWKHASILYQL